MRHCDNHTEQAPLLNVSVPTPDNIPAMAEASLISPEARSLLLDVKSDDLLSINSITVMASGISNTGNSTHPTSSSQTNSRTDLMLRDIRTFGPLVLGPRPLVNSDPHNALLLETDVRMCRLHHSRSLIRKILDCGCRKRWRNCHMLLGTEEIAFLESNGSSDFSVPYCTISDISAVPFWKRRSTKFQICLTLCDSSLILQTADLLLRNQLLHSLLWKKCAAKFDKILSNARSAELPTNDFKQMIELVTTSPLEDDSMHQYPLDLLSVIIQENDSVACAADLEEMIQSLAPLLEVNHSTQPAFDFFSKYCRHPQLSSTVLQLYMPLVHRILKHNMDFGKYPRKRLFVQEFIEALRFDHSQAVWNFLKSVHGHSFLCPHLRVLPNMVSVCLATVYSYYEDKKSLKSSLTEEDQMDMAKLDQKLVTYLTIMQIMSQYEDWRPQIACLLQPIPFPDDALVDDFFTLNMKSVLHNIADDSKCDIHRTVLGVRENRNGWFDLYCPGGVANSDDGDLYSVMLKRLVGCCCRRKQFLQMHLKMVGAWTMLALRENEAAIDTLLALLEYELCDDDATVKQQVVTALKSTTSGQKVYYDFCQQQLLLQVIQQKGGPVKLTLPAKFTDADFSKLLNSGSFGNLECLSLAFTQVTSACARDLIKLRSLRYLSLWSTQFGDAGLQLLTEHMPMLQVLNLCETPVTDAGLRCLSALKNLRKLNLNSTHLSARTFEALKEQLPLLQEYDIRYTDAW